MKQQNRWLSILVAMVFMVVLTGCEQTSTSSTTGTSTTTGSTSSTSGTSTTSNTSSSATTSDNGGISGLDGESVTVTNSGSLGNSDPNSSSAGSSTAQKVAEIGAQFPSRYSSSGSFPYAAGTENGNLGCANVVSAVLKEAGVSAWSLGCYDLRSQLQGQGWSRVSPPPKAGDVIVWSPLRAGGHPHIGVIVKNGNSLMAMNNSSSQRKPILSGWNSRGVETILRKA